MSLLDEHKQQIDNLTFQNDHAIRAWHEIEVTKFKQGDIDGASAPDRTVSVPVRRTGMIWVVARTRMFV